jgi:hypothetical protein
LKVLAWSLRDAQPVRPDNLPTASPPGPAISPDRRLRAEPHFNTITIVDTALHARQNLWPVPNAAERRRYHMEQAALAQTEKQWFAVAFHVGRLLLDTPNDGNLKRRRDDALRRHEAVSIRPVGPLPMEKVP